MFNGTQRWSLKSLQRMAMQKEDIKIIYILKPTPVYRTVGKTELNNEAVESQTAEGKTITQQD